MKLSIKLSIDTLIRKLSHTQGHMGKRTCEDVERDGNYLLLAKEHQGLPKIGE